MGRKMKKLKIEEEKLLQTIKDIPVRKLYRRNLRHAYTLMDIHESSKTWNVNWRAEIQEQKDRLERYLNLIKEKPNDLPTELHDLIPVNLFGIFN